MLRIGVAQRDFTPSRPAMIQGQMHVRIGREAKAPLTLTAIAFEGEEARAIVISCDMAMVSERLVAIVRQHLAQRLPDLPPEALIMTATHTHDSLVIEDWFYTHPGGDVMTPAECLAARAVAPFAQLGSFIVSAETTTA